ncbi:MAG: hypothetical protein AAFV53_30990 [Myxococcota bacterium]
MSWLMMALPAAFAQAATETPDGVDAMYRALSAREMTTTCQQLAEMSAAPVSALVYIAENARRPAWAGIRAADCLSRHHAQDAQPQLTRWVGQEETRGLAIVVLNNLEQMPVAVSVPLAQAAMAGPMIEDARPRIQTAQVPQVRAIAEDVPDQP